jgi:hypothetical protein
VITFDNSEQAQGANDLTWSHTVGSGNNRYLLIGYVGGTTNGVTYNGTALTLLGEVFESSAGVYYRLYGLANPAVGTHDAVVTSSVAAVKVAFSISLSGVFGIGNVVTEQVVSSIISTDIDTTYPSSWVVEFEGTQNPASDFTQNSSQTEREDLGGTSWSIGCATKAFTTPGTQSLQYTSSANAVQVQILAEIIDEKHQANNLIFI